MATTPFANMFLGNNVKVEYAAAPASGVATKFSELKNLASFPAVGGAESNIVEIKQFGEAYSRKLAGGKKVPDIDIKVNWIPGDVGHEAMAAFAESAELVQLKITYYESVAEKNGFFVIVNGYVTSTTVSGDYDKQVQMDFKFTVSGAPVKRGLIDPALPAV
ncbi:hypothetical protein DCF38_10940 [Edwardsiella piscicida]|uniref:phage tail tube protein n=1 Tax=Edwardsiella piscicida TaxID=1263550 RepID=UPI001056F887|nr:phage tail tube protein [Edwardsiella piscicida]UCQ40052.1 hypothetical protein DCF38_10940 [Edwardsiella piscicida]